MLAQGGGGYTQWAQDHAGGNTGTVAHEKPGRDAVELADEQWREMPKAGTSGSAHRPFGGEQDAPCTHCVHTVHLFYLDNLRDAIVLLCCCPVRCRVAELVPRFSLHALRTALYMLFPGL